MTFDLLTVVALQIVIGGLIGLVGLYCARLEHKKAHPEKQTPMNNSSPAMGRPL